jgi:peptidoglycan/xylan/chitin deacetylase (PgdA/CDA1 family)
MKWPDQKDFPVIISVDVDGDLPLLAADPANIDRQKSRSVGLYGVEQGAPRLLSLFDELGVTANWFFPGEIANRYQSLFHDVRGRGHQIGVHGNKHLNFNTLTLDEQIEEMLSGKEVLDRLSGAPVEGFRVPQGEWVDGFLEAMAEAGFRWSSSLPADEYPFSLGDSGLVEVPFRYDVEDMQAMGFNIDPPFPPGQSRIMPLEVVRDNWEYELRGANTYGSLLHIKLNAEVIGFPSRIAMLREFIEHIRDDFNAWFTNCNTLAEHAKKIAFEGDSEPHPFDLFMRLKTQEA